MKACSACIRTQKGPQRRSVFSFCSDVKRKWPQQQRLAFIFREHNHRPFRVYVYGATWAVSHGLLLKQWSFLHLVVCCHTCSGHPCTERSLQLSRACLFVESINESLTLFASLSWYHNNDTRPLDGIIRGQRKRLSNDRNILMLAFVELFTRMLAHLMGGLVRYIWMVDRQDRASLSR